MCDGYLDVLLMLLSPAGHSSNSTQDTGGFAFISPAQDQRTCSSCVAFAGTAAAEAAIAASLRQDWSVVGLSEQDLAFCRWVRLVLHASTCARCACLHNAPPCQFLALLTLLTLGRMSRRVVCSTGSNYVDLTSTAGANRLQQWAARQVFPYRASSAGVACERVAALPTAVPTGMPLLLNV